MRSDRAARTFSVPTAWRKRSISGGKSSVVVISIRNAAASKKNRLYRLRRRLFSMQRRKGSKDAKLNYEFALLFASSRSLRLCVKGNGRYPSWPPQFFDKPDTF